MPTRFDIERAVLKSDLPAGWRHLMHVLCIRLDAQAGVILSAYQPSLSDLARDTALHRRTVMRYLTGLEGRGWITRRRPPIELARRLHRRTSYGLQVPEGYPQARDGMPPGLGANGHLARDTAPPGLGAAPAGARGTAPHGSSESSGSSDLDAIINAIKERDGVTVDRNWAARVREQILGARDVRHPAAYMRRAIRDAPPGTYSPAPQPPPFRAPQRAATTKGQHA